MEKVSAFEAKTNLSKLLREKGKGKSFLICRRGKEVAQLLPPADPVGRNGLQSIAAAFRRLSPSIHVFIHSGLSVEWAFAQVRLIKNTLSYLRIETLRENIPGRINIRKLVEEGRRY